MTLHRQMEATDRRMGALCVAIIPLMNRLEQAAAREVATYLGERIAALTEGQRE